VPARVPSVPDVDNRCCLADDGRDVSPLDPPSARSPPFCRRAPT
jgi:hypothetical protein